MSTTMSAIVDVCRQNPKFAFSGSICYSFAPQPLAGRVLCALCKCSCLQKSTCLPIQRLKQVVHNWSLEYWDRANNVSCASRLIWSDLFCCVLIKFLLQKEKVRVLKSSIQVQIGRMIAGKPTLKCSICVHIRELLVNIACYIMFSSCKFPMT